MGYLMDFWTFKCWWLDIHVCLTNIFIFAWPVKVCFFEISFTMSSIKAYLACGKKEKRKLRLHKRKDMEKASRLGREALISSRKRHPY